VRSPADASPSPSRVPTHGSGPRWFRYAFPVEDLHPYSLPVSRRTQIKFKLLLMEAIAQPNPLLLQLLCKAGPRAELD
jgi:hypothetical protein